MEALDEVDLVGGEGGLRVADAGPGAPLIGDGAGQDGGPGVELGPGRHLAAREPGHLLEPRQAGARLGHRGVSWATLAEAAARAAWERSIWSWSLAVSSSTRTWPFLIRSFTSTLTLRTVPESSLPMLIERVGWSVPLAVTVRVSAPRVAGWVV